MMKMMKAQAAGPYIPFLLSMPWPKLHTIHYFPTTTPSTARSRTKCKIHTYMIYGYFDLTSRTYFQGFLTPQKLTEWRGTLTEAHHTPSLPISPPFHPTFPSSHLRPRAPMTIPECAHIFGFIPCFFLFSCVFSSSREVVLCPMSLLSACPACVYSLLCCVHSRRNPIDSYAGAPAQRISVRPALCMREICLPACIGEQKLIR